MSLQRIPLHLSAGEPHLRCNECCFEGEDCEFPRCRESGERYCERCHMEWAGAAHAEYRAGIPQAQRLMREHRICNGDDMVKAMERGL